MARLVPDCVFENPEGLVYQSVADSHSHWPKDFLDTGRGGRGRGAERVDLLTAEAWADDNLAA